MVVVGLSAGFRVCARVGVICVCKLHGSFLDVIVMELLVPQVRPELVKGQCFCVYEEAFGGISRDTSGWRALGPEKTIDALSSDLEYWCCWSLRQIRFL
jgi:hypothetical protein